MSSDDALESALRRAGSLGTPRPRLFPDAAGASGSASGSAAGVSGGIGKPVPLFRPVGTYCYSLIGSQGTKFCIRSNCTIAHRSGAKFQPARNHLYIQKVRDQEAFVSPTLDGDRIPLTYMEDLLCDARTVKDWHQFFTSANLVDSEQITFADTKAMNSFLAQSKTARTPGKPRQPPPLEESAETVKVEKDFASILSFPPTDLFDKPSNQITIDEAKRTLKSIAEFLSNLGTHLPPSLETMRSDIDADSEMSLKLNARLVSVEDDLGSTVGSEASHQLGPTVWGAIGALADSVFDSGSVKPDPDKSTSATTVNPPSRAEWNGLLGTIAKLQPMVGDAQKTASNTSGQMQKFVVPLIQRLLSGLEDLNHFRDDAEKAISQLRHQAANATTSSTPSGLSTGGATGLEALLRQAGISSAPTAGPTLSGGDVQTLVDKLVELEQDVRDLRDDSSNRGHGSVGGDDAASRGRVTFGGLNWDNSDDARKWIKEHLPTSGCPPYGAFVDIYLLLEWIAIDDGMSETTILQTYDKLNKLGLSTAEARAITAVRNQLPTVFGVGITPSNRSKTYLPALSKYSDWDQKEYRSGLKGRIEDKLPVSKRGIRNLGAETLGQSQEARLLADACLEASAAFLGLLSRYIDDTYNQLLIAGFPPDRSWHLVSQLVHRIFCDMNKVRVGLEGVQSLSNKLDVAAAVMLAVMRTHEYMGEYSRANIENHPSVSSEYVRFLTHNSGLQKVASLEAAITALEKENKALKTELATVAKASKAATATASQAMNKAEAAKSTADKALAAARSKNS